MQSLIKLENCFAGDYQIISLIEAGSQAKAYLVEKNGEHFCLKMYHNNKNSIRCFENQCSVLSDFSHPGIIGLVGVYRNVECSFEPGIIQHRSFLVMEYCQRGDLTKSLHKAPFPPHIARAFIKQLAQILWRVQDSGIIHRDIKPENIGVTNKLQLKLIDFGWSIYGASRRKQFVGTMNFIAPQVHTKRQYTSKSDIFSLGVVYFMMITGLHPFLSSKPTDKIYNLIINRRFKEFWVLAEKNCQKIIEGSAKRLLESMLAWRPQDRISYEQILASQEMNKKVAYLQEIKEFLDGQETQLKCEETEERSTKQCQIF